MFRLVLPVASILLLDFHKHADNTMQTIQWQNSMCRDGCRSGYSIRAFPALENDLPDVLRFSRSLSSVSISSDLDTLTIQPVISQSSFLCTIFLRTNELRSFSISQIVLVEASATTYPLSPWNARSYAQLAITRECWYLHCSIFYSQFLDFHHLLHYCLKSFWRSIVVLLEFFIGSLKQGSV